MKMRGPNIIAFINLPKNYHEFSVTTVPIFAVIT